MGYHSPHHTTPHLPIAKVYFNLKLDGATLDIFDCKTTPTMDHIHIHRPMMRCARRPLGFGLGWVGLG